MNRHSRRRDIVDPDKQRCSHTKLGLMLKSKPLRPLNGPCVSARVWQGWAPLEDTYDSLVVACEVRSTCVHG